MNFNRSIVPPRFGHPFELKTNDNLDIFIFKYYGLHPSQTRLVDTLRDLMLLLNPELRSVKQPFKGKMPRTLDFISTDPHYFLCVPREILRHQIEQVLYGRSYDGLNHVFQHRPSGDTTRHVYEFLASLSTSYEFSEPAISTGVGVFAHMSGQNNRRVLEQLAQLHQLRQNGGIDRADFLLKKKALLDSYTRSVGPLGKVLHGEWNMRSHLNNAPPQGFTRRAAQLARLAQKAKIGGLVLMATGVAMTASKVCTEEDTYTKNLELVRGVGSLVGGLGGGLLGGFAISLVVASGPVGWALAFVVSGATSYFAGDWGADFTGDLYDQHGNEFDIASATGITRLCQ